MMINVLWFVFALLMLRLGIQLLLDRLNRQEVRSHSGEVPLSLQEQVDAETYQRSVDYTLAKSNLSSLETAWDTLILGIVLFSGLLPAMWSGLEIWLGTGIWGQAAILFTVGIIIGLPSIPFDWYSQFRLEERFGFNKSTLRLWLTDKLKGLLIGMILGLPLIAFLLWLVGVANWWWLWGFIGVFAFQLIMVVLYPMCILPLFNKLTPLQEGELRDRLLALGQRTGFRAQTILVMDGSKRSGHSNAFFTGFGRFRRIVLYDTLIEQLNPRQLEAVLAHEIGHYKKGHIPKMLAVAGFTMLVSFALIGWLANAQWFVTAFGFEFRPGMLAPALLLFSLCSGLVTFWLSPLSNHFSRRHEYEADAYAKAQLDGDPQPLIESLRILSQKNLSNFTPHPLYSSFYYSHPTLLEREEALLKGG